MLTEEVHIKDEPDNTVEDPTQWQCLTCNQLFKDNHDLTLHSIIHSKHESYTKCVICFKKFRDKEILRTHYQDKHQIGKIDAIKVKVKRTLTEQMKDYNFNCDICYMTFSRVSELLHHRKTHEQDNIQKANGETKTKKIREKTKQNSEAKKELSIVNKEPKERAEGGSKTKRKKGTTNNDEETNNKPKTQPIMCMMCSELFPNDISLISHSIIHSNEQKYSCPMCNYQNTNLSYVCNHAKKHVNLSQHVKFRCSVCSRACTNKKRLLRHESTHAKQPRQCEVCGKHFANEWCLSTHQQTMHYEVFNGGQRPTFPCSLCENKYSRKACLRYHLERTHLKKPRERVVCDICGKSLSSKLSLVTHRRMHTGEKPFKCPTCSKAFTKNAYLKDHIKTHTGAKPFQCGFCGKGFSQRTSAKIHERIHTGVKPYKCDKCSKAFVSLGAINSHKKGCRESSRKRTERK